MGGGALTHIQFAKNNFPADDVLKSKVMGKCALVGAAHFLKGSGLGARLDGVRSE